MILGSCCSAHKKHYTFPSPHASLPKNPKIPDFPECLLVIVLKNGGWMVSEHLIMYCTMLSLLCIDVNYNFRFPRISCIHFSGHITNNYSPFPAKTVANFWGSPHLLLNWKEVCVRKSTMTPGTIDLLLPLWWSPYWQELSYCQGLSLHLLTNDLKTPEITMIQSF